MSGNLHAATIADALRRCRRRLLVVEFFRNASVAGAVALVAAEFTLLFGTRVMSSAASRWTALGWLGAALAVASLRTLTRRPSLRQTAAIVDGRLTLADRLVTAVQCLDQPDAFARLVERDAAARIAGVRPAAAFPLVVPRTGRLAFAAAAAVPVVFILATTVREQIWTRGVSAPASSQAGLDMAAPSSPDGNASRASASSPSSATQRAVAMERRGGELSPRIDAASGSRESSQPHSASTPDARYDDNGGSAGRAGTNNATAAPQTSSGAGGVGAGALSRRTVDVPPPADLVRIEDTQAYRAAWTRAQAAVAPDRIPADRRVLVKNYFTAVRPSEHR